LLENLKKDPVEILGKVYAFFKDIPFEDKEQQAKNIFKLLYEGDKYLTKLWLIFRYLSILEFEKVYKILNIKFDTYLGESYAEKFVPDIIKLLEENDYLYTSR
jgi:arginyl-tRNA synthetase